MPNATCTKVGWVEVHRLNVLQTSISQLIVRSIFGFFPVWFSDIAVPEQCQANIRLFKRSKFWHVTIRSLKINCRESPTTRGAGGLDFSAIGGKKQRHGSVTVQPCNRSAVCKAPGLKTPNLSWHESWINNYLFACGISSDNPCDSVLRGPNTPGLSSFHCPRGLASPGG